MLSAPSTALRHTFGDSFPIAGRLSEWQVPRRRGGFCPPDLVSRVATTPKYGHRSKPDASKKW